MSAAPYRTRNALVLAKTETTPGTDAAPTPSADAVLVEDPQAVYALDNVETNEVTGDLDVGTAIPAGGRSQFRCSVVLRGSGSGSTPPDVAPLLRACSLGQTVTSSAVTGTAQSGTTSYIRLATGASSSDHAYTGMVVRITGGTGAGQSRVIYSYVGSTRDAYVNPAWTTAPDNTSTYSIDANVRYAPATQEAQCTIYYYQHHEDGANSKLLKMIGCAGTADLELGVRDVPRWRFDMRATLTAPSDVTRPATPTYDNLMPPPFVGAEVYLNDAKIAAARLTINLNADAQMLDDPNESYGYAMPQIVQRRIGLTINIPQQTESTLNALASWSGGTNYRLSARWGSSAGNRFALVVPSARFTDWRRVDNSGYAYFEATARPEIDAPVPFALTYW